jgi:hypothetical protein
MSQIRNSDFLLITLQEALDVCLGVLREALPAEQGLALWLPHPPSPEFRTWERIRSHAKENKGDVSNFSGTSAGRKK